MNSSRESLRPILKRLSAGRNSEAAILLARRLERDPHDEVAWHLLSSAVDDPGRQVFCLERALEINPRNHAAAARLAELSGTAAPTQVAEAAAEEEGEEEEEEAEPHPGHPRPPPRARGRGFRGRQAVALSRPLGRSALVPGDSPAAAAPAIPLPRRGFVPTAWQQLAENARQWRQRFRVDWQAFARSPLAALALGLLLLFALMAVAHPILMHTVWPEAIYDPLTGYDARVPDHPSLPGPGHLLGTDALGRDVLSRLLAAAAPTFVLALAAGLATAVVGTIFSLAAATLWPALDAIITHLAGVFLLLPAPVLMVIVGVRFRELGPGSLGLIYGLWAGAGGTVLILRAYAAQVMSKPYIEAAEVAGASPGRVIASHLLPGVLPCAALQMMAAVPGAVVADGFLSFFGLARGTGNWGTIVYDALAYPGIGGIDRVGHMLVPAAVCLSLFALAFYLLGTHLEVTQGGGPQSAGRRPAPPRHSP